MQPTKLGSVGATGTLEHGAHPITHRLQRQVNPLGDFAVGQPDGQQIGDFPIEGVGGGRRDIRRRREPGHVAPQPVTFESGSAVEDLPDVIDHSISGLLDVDDVDETVTNSSNLQCIAHPRGTEHAPSGGAPTLIEGSTKQLRNREP